MKALRPRCGIGYDLPGYNTLLTKKMGFTTLNCQINNDRTSVNQAGIFGCGSTALGAPLEIPKHIQ
jgi:hypothetical protein